MKIENITATLHRHEIDLPGIGESIESRMFVFVEVETDDGMKGFGITGSILPWAIIACIEHHLAPALKGRDVVHTEDIHSHVWRKLNSRAYTGVVSNALSAIDIALWDIRGKKENRSIHELLGGFRNWAPTYATFGYPFFDEVQLAEYAKKFIADGHRMLHALGFGQGGVKQPLAQAPRREHDPRWPHYLDQRGQQRGGIGQRFKPRRGDARNRNGRPLTRQGTANLQRLLRGERKIVGVVERPVEQVHRVDPDRPPRSTDDVKAFATSMGPARRIQHLAHGCGETFGAFD